MEKTLYVVKRRKTNFPGSGETRSLIRKSRLAAGQLWGGGGEKVGMAALRISEDLGALWQSPVVTLPSETPVNCNVGFTSPNSF